MPPTRLMPKISQAYQTIGIFVSEICNFAKKLRMSQPVISVIICSINPELASKAVENLRQTAGVELEVHVIDNRNTNRPIAQVYNSGAESSVAPYLLFIHEDVCIETQDWGRILASKLEEKSCGVIGFAGSTLWLPGPYAWWSVPVQYHRSNYRHIEDGKPVAHILPPGLTAGFMPVVSLDGVAMAVRKEVWAQHPFDEKVLTGFHCYDIDFSVEISRHHINYVNYDISILHMSDGKYDQRWLEISEQVFVKKWVSLSPMSADRLPSDIEEIEDKAMYRYVFRKIRTTSPKADIKRLINAYKNRTPMNARRMRRAATLLWHYFTHKAFR